jgi:chromosome segregation ATPase
MASHLPQVALGVSEHILHAPVEALAGLQSGMEEELNAALEEVASLKQALAERDQESQALHRDLAAARDARDVLELETIERQSGQGEAALEEQVRLLEGIRTQDQVLLQRLQHDLSLCQQLCVERQQALDSSAQEALELHNRLTTLESTCNRAHATIQTLQDANEESRTEVETLRALNLAAAEDLQKRKKEQRMQEQVLNQELSAPQERATQSTTRQRTLEEAVETLSNTLIAAEQDKGGVTAELAAVLCQLKVAHAQREAAEKQCLLLREGAHAQREAAERQCVLLEDERAGFAARAEGLNERVSDMHARYQGLENDYQELREGYDTLKVRHAEQHEALERAVGDLQRVRREMAHLVTQVIPRAAKIGSEQYP